MKKITIFTLLSIFLIPFYASAHRSGCHRWHSCPSDSGSYTCGDLGYPCQYPTYSNVTGNYYPPTVVETPLRYGARGAKVILLQNALKDTGFYSYGLATGYFGKLTEEAVRKFQRENNLEPVGYVGPRTKEILKTIYGIEL